MQISFSSKVSTNVFMNHLQGTRRVLIPSKPLAPLLALDWIVNKFNSHLSRGLANRRWLWKLHTVSQSSVNYILQKDVASPLLYNFYPSAATASELMWHCTEPGIRGLIFSQISELLTPVSALQVLELEPQNGKAWVAGKEIIKQQGNLTSDSANSLMS